jgi:hypothetical protein
MSQLKQLIKSGCVLTATGLLAACGGGGGGGGGTAGIAAAAPVVVTSANATQVASASLGASDGLSGNTTGILGVVPAAVGSTPSTDVNIVETIIDQVRKAPQTGGSGVSIAAVQNIDQPCDSGTLSVSFNDADNSATLTTGDTVSMSANNCTFSGVTMNGSISVSNIVVTGDQVTPPYSLQLSLTTSGFSVSSGGEVAAINGDGTILESTSDGIDGITVTSSFSGAGIQLTAGGETLTLTNYQITNVENETTGAYSVAISATISISSLGGSVTVTTDVPLSGVFPYEADNGHIICTGDNSSVTITVIDSTSVQLDVDLNGDGTIDDTVFKAWTNL